VQNDLVVRRRDAHPVPRQAEVSPVDLKLAVELHLAVGGGDLRVERTGRVRLRTVSRPVTRTSPSAAVTPLAAKVKSGWLATSKKSAERRWLSRVEFLVSTEPAATVMTPLAFPAAVTVP
jgi:hypothetical protein